MMWKNIFISLVVLSSIKNCDSCLSKQSKEPPKPPVQTPASIKSPTLYVEGQLNENTIQTRADTTPKTIYFNETNQIKYSCFESYTDPVSNDMTVQWVHKKGDIITFYGNISSHSGQIQMDLFTFDHNTTISCNGYSKKLNLSISTKNIPMYLSETPLELSPLTKIEKVIEGEKFRMPDCKNQGSLLAVPSNNSKIITNQFHEFVITKEHDGMMLYCVSRNVTIPITYTLTERLINNVTKLVLKNPEDDILIETYGSTAGKSPIFRTIVIIVAVTSIIGLLTCVVYRLCVCKRKRIHGNQLTDANHSEPVYATPHQVIYAQLQMTENARSNASKSNRIEESSPYAEIVGIMESCDRKD